MGPGFFVAQLDPSMRNMRCEVLSHRSLEIRVGLMRCASRRCDGNAPGGFGALAFSWFVLACLCIY